MANTTAAAANAEANVSFVLLVFNLFFIVYTFQSTWAFLLAPAFLLALIFLVGACLLACALVFLVDASLLACALAFARLSCCRLKRSTKYNIKIVGLRVYTRKLCYTYFARSYKLC